VAKCANVSSVGIMALANSSVQLQELTLSYCLPVCNPACVDWVSCLKPSFVASLVATIIPIFCLLLTSHVEVTVRWSSIKGHL
jgi:hypothetical protein